MIQWPRTKRGSNPVQVGRTSGFAGGCWMVKVVEVLEEVFVAFKFRAIEFDVEVAGPLGAPCTPPDHSQTPVEQPDRSSKSISHRRCGFDSIHVQKSLARLG